MSENKKLTPKIRFKGFTEDWEQRKLNNMCSIITKQTGFDYSATIKPSLVEHKIPNSYSFIQNKDFEGLNINLNTDFYIPKNIADQFPKITLDTPSLLISISGKIGNIGLYSLKNKAFIGGAVGICKLLNPDDGIISTYELESDYGQKYFQSLIKASSHANITVEDIRNIELILPKDNKERSNISKFLLNIDNLITLHQRKYDKLVKIKSSLLEKMFPKNSSKIPEVRFKGFTEDWEQRKLDDICNRYDNLRVPVAANERIPGSTPYYGANGIQDYVKGHTHDGEFVLVAEDGANDLKNYPVQYVNGLFWANNHVHVIQAKDKIASNKYLKYAISQTNIEPLLVGGGRAKLNANIMMDIPINTPGNIEEQNILGTFINEIDNLITLHQR